MNPKDHQFLAMWDCYGLETLIDITETQGAKVWATLQGKPDTVSIPNLMHLELRARYNSQRHYEIYIFNAQEGITANDIRGMFDADPQTAADLIRKHGHCYYSDRQKDHEIAIR